MKLYIMDAAGLATKYGLKGKINVICLAAFFQLAGVLPVDSSIQLLREAIKKAYSDKGEEIVQRNLKLLDAVCSDQELLISIEVPSRWRRATLTEERRAFNHRHIALISDEETKKFMDDIHTPVS